MASSNRRKRKGSVLDIKQVLFMLIGLCIGAGVIFIVGLQVGQHVDISEDVLAMASMGVVSQAEGEKSRTKDQPKAKEQPKDEFAFFADLGSPAPERKRRKLYGPEGNANNPDKVTRAQRNAEVRKARRHARVKAKKPKARTIARKTPGEVALSSVSRRVDVAGAARTLARVLPRLTQETKSPAPAAGEAVTEKPSFTVHVGSYPSFEEASAAMQRLRSQGHSPHVTLTNREGEGKLYRVRVGRYPTQEAARHQIRSSGLSGAVVGL